MVTDSTIQTSGNGRPPTMREMTKNQIMPQLQMGFNLLNLSLDATLTSSFATPAQGTIKIYRKMLRHPSIALARIARRAPMKAAGWSYTATREDPNADAAKQLIETVFAPVRRRLVADMLSAEDFGFSPFELVYGVRDVEGTPRFVVEKFKPLLPEKTRPLIDKDTGEFVGVKNFATEIPREKVLWWKSDDENGNIWGIGANERARPYWWNHAQTVQQSGKYIKVASVPIPLVTYPPGESRDASGSLTDNSEIAKRLIKKVQEENKGVILPDKLSKYVENMLATGKIDPAKAQAWKINFIEAKTSAGNELIGFLGYWDKLMVRAWLLPERALLEGEHGTKAEAATHTNISIASSEDYLSDMVECLNLEVVDNLLALNFGEDARGLIRIEPAPVVDKKRELLEKLITQVLTAPNNVDLFLRTIAIDQALEQLELPTVDDVDSITDDVTDERVARMQQRLEQMRSATPPPLPNQPPPLPTQ